MSGRTLLFEIGVEELPAGYVPPALEQLEHGARDGLVALYLTFESVRTYGTPRRLALEVTGLADRQPDRDEDVLGPATKVAFDADGKPTKALIGFCAGKGVDVATVRRVDTPKGEYVAVTVHHTGRPATDVLPALLASNAAKLQFPKSMRWLNDDTRFGRPVRWLVALLDDQILPVRQFQLDAGRDTPGHRFLAREPVSVAHARDYLATLERTHVLGDPSRREGELTNQIGALATKAGGTLVADSELIEINNYLVEWPTAFLGSFDAKYLDLPTEVIVTALREHQRFFAVERDGALLPNFIAVRNGDDRGLDTVRVGNERVLVARLEDAKFYWDSDLKKTPAEQVESLSGIVWMEGLGSLREKAERLVALGGWLAERLAPAEADTVRRAALLAKTDLLSEMIGSGKEYASLEGVMGGHYATRAGEPKPVATAIAEHYAPRGANDAPPASMAGALLSLADKLDHVVGAFVAGKVPSGSEDPYGVRRAGNGVVRIAITRDLRLDLRDTMMQTTAPLYASDPELPQAEIMKKLGEFWRGRVDVALDDRDIPYDAREAAIESRPARGRMGWIDPADCLARAQALETFRGDPRFTPLVILFKRVANILAKATEALPAELDRAKLREPVEIVLLRALDKARQATAPLWDKRDYAAILPALLDMEQAIHGFFDGVLVNAEDMEVRLTRLKLLSDIRDLFVRGWDLSKIVVEGERS